MRLGINPWFFILLLLFPHSDIFAEENIRIATTTSVDNSGLLDFILPQFKKQYGLGIQVIAVGTGMAIRLGKDGDVDLILIHNREAGDKFVKEAYGRDRKEIMYNDFLIVGPEEDPGQIKSLKDPVFAFGKIYREKLPFVSRGDDSGTQAKEASLWKESNLRPGGKWYFESGQGMGATLKIAEEKKAYTLIDRATFLAFKNKSNLVPLLEGDKRLFNLYEVIAVNPKIHPQAKYKKALQFINWLISPEGQKLIGRYKKEGESLFHPIRK